MYTYGNHKKYQLKVFNQHYFCTRQGRFRTVAKYIKNVPKNSIVTTFAQGKDNCYTKVR